VKKITISDESYWKLMEIKVKLKCGTWKEMINELHKMVFETDPFTNKFPRKLKTARNEGFRH